MADLIYLIIGVIAGLIVGGTLIYLLPYQTVRREQAMLQTDLAEAQAKNNQLQSNLLDGQSHTYQARQAALLQQRRLESELAEAGERQSELERQSAEIKAYADQRQEQAGREAALLRNTIARLEQEQEALQDRFARQGTEWDRERQSLLLQIAQFDGQMQTLQQDRLTLDNRFEQQRDSWEEERLALQIQMNTLEDTLTLQKARAGQGLPADSAQGAEQIRADAEAELKRRQTAWDDERQALQGQIERLQAERQSLRERVAQAAAETTPEGPQSSHAEEAQELRRQLDRQRQERKNLEEKLAAREQRAEQERGALEAEIEQLMERLLRLHREHNA